MRYNDSIEKILKKLNITQPVLLGEGGEGTVFTFSNDKVVKIYKDVKADYLLGITDFQNFMSQFNLPFDLPLTYKIGSVDNTYYTIEKRLTGTTLDKVFGPLNRDDKYLILKRYFDGLKSLHSIRLPQLPYGQILKPADEVKSDNWQKFLLAKMEDKIDYSKEWLAKDVTNFEQKVRKFNEIIKTELACEDKTFVHGDYFYGNVLVEDLKLTAVIDFSPLSVIGDYRMDVSGAIIFLELSELFTPEYITYLYSLAESEYGKDIKKYIDYYRLYYSFLFANSFEFDQDLYNWCIKNLNNDSYWGI